MNNFFDGPGLLLKRLLWPTFLLLALSLNAGREVKVRILQTTDIHSFIEEGDSRGAGGWLRLATLIKKHRASVGEDKLVLIDCGDTIQGAISGLATRGEAAIDLLNHLKYDFWVLGNHELDFGIPQLSGLVNKCQVPILCGNFALTAPFTRRFKSWHLIERHGARICVIGMQASYLKHWFKGRLFTQYNVEQAYDVLKKEMPLILREQPDMIILALHQGLRFRDSRGISEVKKITQRFPEIDLVLGGHTHQAHSGRNTFGVFYSQAAFHASHLGVIDATIDLKKHRVVKLESYLEEASSRVQKDPEASAVYDKWRTPVNNFANSKIVTLRQPIRSRGTPGKNCAISSLIAQSIMKEAKADFSIHGRFSSYDLKGDVTGLDLYKVIPYENFIYVLSLSKEQLLKTMNEQLKYFSSRSFNGPEGFELILNREKTKVEKLNLPIKKNLYRLAVNSRVAAGGGGRYLWLKAEIESGRMTVQEVETNTREAVAKFLRQLQEPFHFKPFLR